MNAAILLELMLKAAMTMQQYTALLQKSRSEDRDVTRAELLELFGDDDVMRIRLQAEIEARR